MVPVRGSMTSLNWSGNVVLIAANALICAFRHAPAIISGRRLYHNFVRPHQGLPGQITPAEAAGITVEGTNKWLTLIQAAAKLTA